MLYDIAFLDFILIPAKDKNRVTRRLRQYTIFYNQRKNTIFHDFMTEQVFLEGSCSYLNNEDNEVLPIINNLLKRDVEVKLSTNKRNPSNY